MRYRILPFKFHIFNFNFIYYHYGTQGFSLLKRWIDTNYRIIRTHSKIYFLRQCKTHHIYPQHIVHIAELPIYMFHHKAIRKVEGLMCNIKAELLRIEIFDLYKYLHFLNSELSHLSDSLLHLLPNFVWYSIKKHHSLVFNNFKDRSHFSHHKKFLGLLMKRHNDSINNISKINYTFHHASKKFHWNNNNPSINKTTTPQNTNVIIDPHNFNSKFNDVLDHTNNKWFINLSDINIPHEVSILLQLGERFCLPMHLDKKYAIHEFIKDIESNASFHETKK